MVLPAPAYLLYAVLPAVQMHHLMDECVQHLLYLHVQRFGGYVHLVLFSVLVPPYLGAAAMPVCPRLALHGDNWRWQFAAEQVSVDDVVHLFQLSHGPAHFGCLFHVYLRFP